MGGRDKVYVERKLCGVWGATNWVNVRKVNPIQVVKASPPPQHICSCAFLWELTAEEKIVN